MAEQWTSKNDLIQLLREKARAAAGHLRTMLNEAADELEQLQNENDALREVVRETTRERDELLRGVNEDEGYERLRAALASIFDNTTDGGARLIASEALSSADPDKYRGLEIGKDGQPEVTSCYHPEEGKDAEG